MSAMNTTRMLKLTSQSSLKATQTLASGYRINRASDDATGLAISEKMRLQIRGLNQATKNAMDGISLIQTAEGALTEVSDILQRMNELAVKAANGTNSKNDRQTIQDEIDELVTEIDRIGGTTKFNETYIFKAQDGITSTSLISQKIWRRETIAPDLSVINAAIGVSGSLSDNGDGTYTYQTGDLEGKTAKIGGTQYHVSDNSWINAVIANTTLYDRSGNEVANSGTVLYGYSSVADAVASGNYYITKSSVSNQVAKERYTPYTSGGGILSHYAKYQFGSGSDAVLLKLEGGNKLTYESSKHFYDKNGNEITQSALNSYIDTTGNGALDGVFSPADWKIKIIDEVYLSHQDARAAAAGSFEFNRALPQGYMTTSDAYSKLNHEIKSVLENNTDPTQKQPKASIAKQGSGGNYLISLTAEVERDELMPQPAPVTQIYLQVGPEPGQGITLQIEKVSSASLGIDDIDVTTQDGADQAINKASKAIDKVNAIRSKLGAYQNRLEHTIKNLENIAENTQAAESRIRDADMSKVVIEYAKRNILMQVGQAMLAQQNQRAYDVLALLN